MSKDIEELLSTIYKLDKEEKKTEVTDNRFIPIAEPQLGEQEFLNISDAYLSTWISSIGKYISEFEEKFSAYCGMNYGVSTSNGTTALHLGLAALGIGPGDEVIVPDITFAATINAVLYVGATPVIVDVEKDSWCIDVDEILKAITKKTKAIIPVHIYGQPCEMKRIMEIASQYKLYVVEDCAEAHGERYEGKKVGSFGDIGCFSFFGNKIITTGEGGMCVTNNAELNDRMRILRDHGMNKSFKYYHDVVGFNYRMTNLQAAVGVAQLEDIESKLQWRKQLEETYRKRFADIESIVFQKRDLRGREKVTWLVTAYVEDPDLRNRLMENMKENRIDARPFFVPLSHMDIYRRYVFSNRNSSYITERGFNLPTSANLSDDDLQRIENVIRMSLMGN